MDLLKDGKEKDYISIIDEVRKGVESGATDLVAGVGTTLFSGLELCFRYRFLNCLRYNDEGQRTRKTRNLER